MATVTRERIAGYDVHPAATAFPMMSDDEIESLAEDIKENGQTDPIVILDGEILDGRHRAKACEIAGVTPMVTKLTRVDVPSPVQYVVSKNLHRRHLSASQRAALALELEPLFKEEAKERALAGASKGGQVAAAKRKGTVPPAFSSTERVVPPVKGKPAAPVTPDFTAKPKPQSDESGRARSQAAATAGASVGYVGTLKKLAATDPKIVEEVKTGKVSIPEAKRRLFPDLVAPARTEKKAPAKRKISRPRSGKVESSRVTLQLTVTFGSIDGAQAIMQKLDADPRVLHMDHETVDEPKSHKPGRKRNKSA